LGGAFGLIFLAELGDKTQLTAMALATRYPWRKIFLDIVLAFAVLNLAAVTVGSVLFALVPLLWIHLTAAALLGGFGIAALRAPSEAAAASDVREGRPFVTAFLMILMAELGDKTQLATAGLAAQDGAPVEVFIGSSIALGSVSLLGIFLGRQLIKHLPLQRIQQAGGFLFLVFAGKSLWQAFQ
jgi:putative Ca2+/H+ antiporter (TMEM165/GDT1 family)